MRINEQGSLQNNGPHKGKGPRGYHRSDDRIKEDICDCLMDDGQLDASNIEIDVTNNEVILSGNVDSREAKRRAENLAECIPGVNNVENRLHIAHNTDHRMDHRNDMRSEQRSEPRTEQRSSLLTENNKSRSRAGATI